MKRVLFVVLCLLICGVSASQMRGLNRDFKYTHSGMQDIGYPCPSIDPGCIFAGWNFEQAVGNYDNDYGAGTYTMVNNGAAVLVDDGTWPHADGIAGTQGEAWDFDGAADYLDRADDDSFDMDLVNNPGGDFSVQCVVTLYDVSGIATFMSKYLAGVNQRAWNFYASGTTVWFSISDNGFAGAGNRTDLGAVGAVAAYRPSFITATYHWVADGSSEMRVYVDNLATATTNIADGPVFDTPTSFEIGSSDVGGNLMDGLLQNCAVYKGLVISEQQHDAMFDQWRGAASTFARDVVTATASASPPAIPFAPPASGTEPFLIDNPANSFYIGSPAANSGGLYGASDLTSKWWRGSCETCDGANHCTGWTTIENQGAGAATVVVDCDATTSAHGGTSILFTADNGAVPKYAEVRGACQAFWVGQDMTLLLRGVTTTGAANCQVRIYEYSDGVCGVFLGTTVVINFFNPGATWAQIRDTMAAGAWNVATNSWMPHIVCHATGTAYTVNVDAFMALQAPATFHTDAGAYCDADADCLTTDTIHSINSPFTANGQMSVVGTWRTPWAGTDLTVDAHLFDDGAFAAANTYHIDILAATDEPAAGVYDNAGAARGVVPNVLNWTADTDHEIRVRTGGNDDWGIYWNAVWDNTMAGAGTGVRMAAQASSGLGCCCLGCYDVWTRNVQMFRRKIQ